MWEAFQLCLVLKAGIFSWKLLLNYEKIQKNTNNKFNNTEKYIIMYLCFPEIKNKDNFPEIFK